MLNIKTSISWIKVFRVLNDVLRVRATQIMNIYNQITAFKGRKKASKHFCSATFKHLLLTFWVSNGASVLPAYRKRRAQREPNAKIPRTNVTVPIHSTSNSGWWCTGSTEPHRSRPSRALCNCPNRKRAPRSSQNEPARDAPQQTLAETNLCIRCSKLEPKINRTALAGHVTPPSIPIRSKINKLRRMPELRAWSAGGVAGSRNCWCFMWKSILEIYCSKGTNKLQFIIHKEV